MTGSAPFPPEAFHREKSLLRFITCGSVDDGKSSLIGRLLYESRMIYDDQYAAISRDSLRHGTTGEDVDFALLVDGLEAEREQGITIDVAYRFFNTDQRAFIVADTPGHEQYSRNMATGASTADLAIILIDARKGILTQTCRHSFICSLMGIRSVVVAVNKMDLVDYAQARFDEIVAGFQSFAADLGFSVVQAIPLSARYGDNVMSASAQTPWYAGPTLLNHLETTPLPEASLEASPLRFPVQWVNRPNLDFRGFAGTLASGVVRVGDPVVVAGSGQQTTVSSIVTFDGLRAKASAGEAVTFTLADEVDISRGDILCGPKDRPEVVDHVAANVIWFSDEPMLQARSYLMRIGTCTVPARVSTLKHKIDVNTREHLAGRTLAMNEIGVCNVSIARPIAIDPFADNRRTGAFILIDKATGGTVGAGMILFGLRRATNVHLQTHFIDKRARASLLHQTPRVLWFTGLSGSGKSTIADLVERKLHGRGFATMLLDGDNMRHGLNRDLGFADADRVENIRRIGEVAKLMVESGLVVLCCFISPFELERSEVRRLLEPDEFVEIFVDVPVDECKRRDPKGLYAKAMQGEISNFTGVSSPYEPPRDPEIRIDGLSEAAESASDRIVGFLLDRNS